MGLYRSLLRRVAPTLDREHGDAVEEMFDTRRREGRAAGHLRLAGFWIREVAGLLKAGASERALEQRRTRRQMLREKRTGVTMLGTIMRDLQFTMRLMRRSPGFTAVVLLTLAVGIGANTVMFSVVNTVLLRPLPYRNPAALTLVRPVGGANRTPGFAAPPDFYRYRAQNRSFEQLDAFFGRNGNLTGGADAERVGVLIVSSAFFVNLGVPPAIGRGFTIDDERWGTHQVAVITDGLWKRRFGQDAAIVGKSMFMDGQPYAIVGVLPPAFAFLNADVQVFVPMSFAPGDNLNSHNNYFLRMVGRLQPSASATQASTDLNAILDAIIRDESVNKGTAISVAPLQDAVVGNVKAPMLVLLGAVGFVLLICCANLANLLLARGVARRREVAVRVALGASQRQVVGQFLVESVLLSAIGGALALAIAGASTKSINLISPQVLPRAADVQIDPTVLLFTFGIATITGVLIGLAPAFQGARLTLADDLKEGSRGTSDGRGSRVRAAIVVAEVALSFVLLAGAGLMIKSMHAMLTLDAGFNGARVLTAMVNLPPQKYMGRGPNGRPSPARMERAEAFYDELTAKTRALPDVEYVGAINGVPLIGEVWGKTVTLLDRPLPADLSGLPSIQYRVVVGDYFRAMGVRILNGRAFTERDTRDAPKVAIVNRAMAKRDYSDRAPIGKLITLDPPTELLPKKLVENAIRAGAPASPPTFQIVGVADDARYGGITTPAAPVVYVPYAQGAQGTTALYLVARTGGDPLALVSPIRKIVSELDREQPIANVATMDARMDTAVARPRLQTTVFSVFALVAILLAVVGIYGVMSYSVSQRAKEIGIRLALGSSRHDVVALVFRNGFVLVAAGIVLGLAAALALARVMRTMVFQVSTTDPMVFGGIALLVLATAACAAWIPARRAALLDPLVTLRAE